MSAREETIVDLFIDGYGPDDCEGYPSCRGCGQELTRIEAVNDDYCQACNFRAKTTGTYEKREAATTE